MNAVVMAEVGMEHGSERALAFHRHGVAIVRGDDTRPGAYLEDPRRADEDGVERTVQPLHVEVGFERGYLAAVVVTRHLHVQQPQPGLVREAGDVARQHDGARARAPQPSACAMELHHRRIEFVRAHELHHRRRLPAGDDHPGQAIEVPRQAHLHHLGAETLERQPMLAERPLQRQHADAHLRPRHAARTPFRSAVATTSWMATESAANGISGPRRVERTNAVSPSNGVCVGRVTRAMPICALSANARASAFVIFASVAATTSVVLAPGMARNRSAAASPSVPSTPATSAPVSGSTRLPTALLIANAATVA